MRRDPQSEPGEQLVPARPAAVPAIRYDAQEPDPSEAGVPIARYLWLVRRNYKLVATIVAVATIATTIATKRITPLYESTAILDIDRNQRGQVVGQAVAAALNDNDQFIATQIRLVQSDSVLRPVAERFHLLERDEERVDETREDREKNADAPVLLRNLRVTRPPNTYLMLVSYRSTDRRLASDVANAVAQSYLEHIYRIRYKEAAGMSRFMEKQLEELRAKMEQSSGALAQHERDLNIIQPDEKMNILGSRLIELNAEFARAQSDRLKKEAAFGALSSGVEQAAQVSTQKEALRKLTDDYNSARQRFAEVKSKYGANHPEHKAAAAHLQEIGDLLASTEDSIRKRVEAEYTEARSREDMFGKAVADTKKELDRMNSRSFVYQNLRREAEGDKKLYEELLRRIKEETINSTFQSSSIRVADPARPARSPVWPRLMLNVALAALLSGVLAVGLVIGLDLMDDTLREPEDVRRTFAVDVIGSLPQVKQWHDQITSLAPPAGLLEGAAPSDHLSSYEEAIRTLRNSILLKDMERRVRTIMFTSATPSEGKSTAASHLAVAHAQQGHRTLLIDGDLRRPTVHQRFGVDNATGLSDVLLTGSDWQALVKSAPVAANLYILTAGPASPRKAADFLGPCVTRLLEEAYQQYDLVVLDAPPLLGFPECLQMAAAADGVVVVAKAGETSRKGVGSVIQTLRQINANLIGVVLNKVHQNLSNSYYYYGYYGKYHSHYKGGEKK